MNSNLTKTERPRNRWVENILYVTTILWLFCFFVWIAVPQAMKNEKRSRTAHAVSHADKSCQEISQWISDKVDSPDSRFDRIEYQIQFPNEADWMENGEPYYRFEFFVDGTYGSSIHDPVVVATPRTGPDSKEVFADVVQSGGIGMASGWDLSNCKTTFEVVSKHYDPVESKDILMAIVGSFH